MSKKKAISEASSVETAPTEESALTAAETPAPSVIAVKGFDLGMTCRGYQFKLGETYTHDGRVIACESGFHSVEFPPDVFGYYPPATSLYAEVEASGEIAPYEGDSKVASGRLHVRVALSIPDIVSRTIAWILERCEPANAQHATGYRSASSATGDQSASLNTGSYSSSEIKAAQDGAALNAVAIASGYQSKARAAAGSAIVLVERDDNGDILHIRASKVGENGGVAPDLWYTLRDGEFVEVTEHAK